MQEKFASSPFRLSGSRGAAFSHPAWRRAESGLLAGVEEASRIVLCGLPGTGKTMLLRSVADKLQRNGRAVRIVARGEPDIRADPDDVLLVDEADGWSPAQISRLCRLPNPIVLAGLPGLRRRVEAGVGLVGGVTLDRLSTADVVHFVNERLAEAGRSRDAFSPEALAALVRHSGGLFRVVVILAGAALFFADLRGAQTVAVADVDEAAAMRCAVGEEEQADCEALAVSAPVRSAPQEPSEPPGSWPRVAAMVTMAGLAAIWLGAHMVALADGAAAGLGPDRVAAAMRSPPPALMLSPKRPLVSLTAG